METAALPSSAACAGCCCIRITVAKRSGPMPTDAKSEASRSRDSSPSSDSSYPVSTSSSGVEEARCSKLRMARCAATSREGFCCARLSGRTRSSIPLLADAPDAESPAGGLAGEKGGETGGEVEAVRSGEPSGDTVELRPPKSIFPKRASSSRDTPPSEGWLAVAASLMRMRGSGGLLVRVRGAQKVEGKWEEQRWRRRAPSRRVKAERYGPGA
mmetsp:Transcript_16681/g.38233  ORF Transcript_16681/g.38233 Transcript_16681/m.38233 type:complete len:214 (+) Transcript_16681:1634-2275(+)